MLRHREEFTFHETSYYIVVSNKQGRRNECVSLPLPNR